MAHMTDLPLDLLNVILVAVAVSSDGARDLARAGATCKVLLIQTRELPILKAVNFQRLTFTTNDFIMHRHTHDLVCLCARAGNWAALSILGKALIVDDPWFWGMIYDDYQRACYGYIKPTETLHQHSLVRMFILYGASKDIATSCGQLLNYVFWHVGYDAARENGLVSAIMHMCSFETRGLLELNFQSSHSHPTLVFVEHLMVRVEPPHEAWYRERVIMAYDQLFPLACY